MNTDGTPPSTANKDATDIESSVSKELHQVILDIAVSESNECTETEISTASHVVNEDVSSAEQYQGQTSSVGVSSGANVARQNEANEARKSGEDVARQENEAEQNEAKEARQNEENEARENEENEARENEENEARKNEEKEARKSRDDEARKNGEDEGRQSFPDNQSEPCPSERSACSSTLLGSELEIGSSHNSNNTGNVEETLSQRGNDVMSSAGNQTEASNSVASNYSEGKHCSSVSTECLHVSENDVPAVAIEDITTELQIQEQTSGRCNLVHLCFHLLLTLSSFLYSQLLLNIMTTESLIQR